ncbi:zinc finger protein 654-like [Oncorhynchus masou masou]|uniref:zinc finger protein 654-like n=1 Tax=Oncorhynchus masou masou TaxID=90313 RepID=UPI003183E790
MAEEESEFELEGFKKELESLFVSCSSEEYGLQSKLYCVRFCKLVEVYSGRWQVPLPQLQVLQTALCSFVQASACFPSDCEHVCYTLSSLALSAFELLLFLNRNKILQDPLKKILDSFQECFSQLERHQNIHLLQVGQIIREKGPWTNPILQAILKDSQLPRDEVDRYLSSEVPVFFELRVRYLLSSEMFTEAVVLAKTCSQHPVAGRHLFFRQAYLTCLLKASLPRHMHEEMSDIDGKDAVDIVCNTESEESDETLLALCTAFLSQQLHRGDMYCMWDLVFIWSRLCLRVNPSKQAFLEETHRLLLSATNIRSIFSFIRVILAEVSQELLGLLIFTAEIPAAIFVCSDVMGVVVVEDDVKSFGLYLRSGGLA